ncbi:hypothetical protein PR003_g1143 [Phytophthora rubi]|uniref:Transcription elongation factor 1 homolog n=1 Tax=Phytophthora rubi TaxID=129364 RepID=A0A6A3P0W8_9STRA|nr:hypothetical protein PR002_g1122 [Phytophthora rubi]KAE9358694.1 hypothetical protein PR003_g1143 [Phytophthora rubi]
MLGRIALRKAALRSSKLASAQTLRPMGLHTTGVARKQEEASEEIAVPTEGLLDQAGLTDWKISAPIIGALAIPAISNHFYVLNEESQLACCFLLFCSASYKFGGEMIASFFDERAAAILGEHNAVEDANLNLAKETLETHKAMLNIHEDIAAVAEAHKEAVALMCEVQAYKLRHKTRDTFVKNLESIREIEASYNLELQKSMVANATSKVRAVVQKGDKKLKDAAFKNALDILGNAKVDDNKEDDVAALFTKELRAYASDLEAKQGQVVKLTEAEQTELQADLDAYMKRFDLEDADFKAPKEVKLSGSLAGGTFEFFLEGPKHKRKEAGSKKTKETKTDTERAMGRRKKSTKKISTRKKQIVSTVFKCPFCSHDEAVECKMDRERNIGHLSCRVCTESFQTPIHYLSAPIDVYTDWIDECEALNA